MNNNTTDTCTVEDRPKRLTKRDDRPIFVTGGDLLDQEATAKRLGTTPRHVRRLHQSRQLKATKVGKLVRFAPAEIDRYIAANTQDGAA